MIIQRLILTTAAALLAAAPLCARTWTSTTGNTVEAECVGRDGTFVILKRTNGSQVKIDIAFLSQADREFLEQPEDPVPAAAPAAPAAAPARPAGQAFGPVTFQATPEITTEQVEGWSPQSPDHAGYVGLQFGPGPDDVLYLMLDAPNGADLPQDLYLFSPGEPSAPPPRNVAGRRTRFGESRVTKFSGIQVGSGFGPLRADFDIEIIVGIERTDVVALLADVKLTSGRTSTRFSMGGYINEKMQVGPGPIPVLRLLDKPQLGVNVRTTQAQPMVYATIAMGPFKVRPPNRRVVLTVSDDDGKTAERAKHEVAEDALLAFSHSGIRTPLTKLDPGTPYTLNAEADLGELIGTFSKQSTFTTRAEND